MPSTPAETSSDRSDTATTAERLATSNTVAPEAVQPDADNEVEDDWEVLAGRIAVGELSETQAARLLLGSGAGETAVNTTANALGNAVDAHRDRALGTRKPQWEQRSRELLRAGHSTAAAEATAFREFTDR
ncbi:MAG: hypothetical protein HOQ24_01390, partial [Mycobacteriaceae bacterium]|nr:hypothetical protein [Mycobacteriaceae bacterium]